MVLALGLEDRVQFVAPQIHERSPRTTAPPTWCLVPTRTESFGLVALEAAACGTPVVAADVGGLRSLVDDGRTGFLVPSRDPVEYAGPRRADPPRPRPCRRHGRERRSRIRARFTWSITAARLRRLYADLLARELVQCT